MRAKSINIPLVFLIFASLLLASSGVILLIGTAHDVADSAHINTIFEPSSANATGAPTWVTGWMDLTDGHIAYWNGVDGIWHNVVFRYNAADIYVAWDNYRTRFVAVYLDTVSNSIYYLHSTDNTATAWTAPVVAMSSALGNWDYPSVSIDGSGRIIVAAYGSGLSTTLSLDGDSFDTPVTVPLATSNARVVALKDRFEVFYPVLGNSIQNPAQTLVQVLRTESLDHRTWASPVSLYSAASGPPNQSPGTYSASCPNPNVACTCSGANCNAIYYGPLLDAKGYPDGHWIVGFPVNNNGYSNIMIFDSSISGIVNGGLVNQAAFDEFLGGVATSSDQGYWVNYYTFSDSARSLPLITQALYFPSTGSAVGATTNQNIDPKRWATFLSRCVLAPGTTSTSCFAAGDYNGISANGYQSASTPFVFQSGTSGNSLYQSFISDPAAVANLPNFNPNFVPYSVGADISGIGKPVGPSQYAPRDVRRFANDNLRHRNIQLARVFKQRVVR